MCVCVCVCVCVRARTHVCVCLHLCVLACECLQEWAHARTSMQKPVCAMNSQAANTTEKNRDKPNFKSQQTNTRAKRVTQRPNRSSQLLSVHLVLATDAFLPAAHNSMSAAPPLMLCQPSLSPGSPWIRCHPRQTLHNGQGQKCGTRTFDARFSHLTLCARRGVDRFSNRMCDVFLLCQSTCTVPAGCLSFLSYHLIPLSPIVPWRQRLCQSHHLKSRSAQCLRTVSLSISPSHISAQCLRTVALSISPSHISAQCLRTVALSISPSHISAQCRRTVSLSISPSHISAQCLRTVALSSLPSHLPLSQICV